MRHEGDAIRADRRRLVVALASLAVPAASPFARAAAGFAGFLETLWPAARAAGVSRVTFEAAVGGLTPDPSLPSADGKQPEFDQPLQAYYRAAVNASRIARGRAERGRWADALARIEPRYGVPGEILLAAWAMESDFGRSRGDRDVVRTLATLAFRRPDRTLFRDEFVAALAILESGVVPRAKMRGSWAGAMGDPQFLPSAFRQFAVSEDGTASPDIWDRPPDVLASIANFLRRSGWQPGLPWGFEIRVPPGFDYAALQAPFEAFARTGFATADGRPLPSRGKATLFWPSGAAGPAFMLSDNYWVIKAYNNSDSYALSLARLGDRMAGLPDLSRPWPGGEKALSRTDKQTVQTLLTRLGLYSGTIDGRFGPSSREAIHAFQRQAGLVPADGYPPPDLLVRLRAAAGSP